MHHKYSSAASSISNDCTFPLPLLPVLQPLLSDEVRYIPSTDGIRARQRARPNAVPLNAFRISAALSVRIQSGPDNQNPGERALGARLLLPTRRKHLRRDHVLRPQRNRMPRSVLRHAFKPHLVHMRGAQDDGVQRLQRERERCVSLAPEAVRGNNDDTWGRGKLVIWAC